jgi:hypothetical protein
MSYNSRAHHSHFVLFSFNGLAPKLSSMISVPDKPCANANVRFGSKAEMAPIKRDVRFTPKSGHRRATV